MVLNAEQIIRTVVNDETKNAIVSIYQIGVSDESPLSDTDIIIVVLDTSTKNILLRQSFDTSIDVRGVYTEDEFLREVRYFSAAMITFIYGKKIVLSPELNSPDEKLVKLACLFFTSFLRNFYECLFLKRPTPVVLKHLNDFEYVGLFVPDFLTPPLGEYIARVRQARKNPDRITHESVDSLLHEGIEWSWKIIDLLNERLKKTFEQVYPPVCFTGKEPTVFAPFSVSDCRKINEAAIKRFSRLKTLVLPLGFQCIYTHNDFIPTYVDRHLSWKVSGFFPLIKQIIKISFASIVRWWIYTSSVHKYFSPLEAYSVRRATTTYSDDVRLLPAEEAALLAARVQKNDRILDVGCGGGRTTFALIDKGFTNIIGIDFSASLIERAQAARGGVYAKNFQALNILDSEKKFGIGVFDVVIFSYNGLDYLFPYDARKDALMSINRLLKPGGMFIFSSHRPVVINRSVGRQIFSWFGSLVRRSPYSVVQQSFGKLVTYQGSHRRITGELKAAGFEFVANEYNVKTLPFFRDPFPYWIVRKKLTK